MCSAVRRQTVDSAFDKLWIGYCRHCGQNPGVTCSQIWRRGQTEGKKKLLLHLLQVDESWWHSTLNQTRNGPSHLFGLKASVVHLHNIQGASLWIVCAFCIPWSSIVERFRCEVHKRWGLKRSFFSPVNITLIRDLPTGASTLLSLEISPHAYFCTTNKIREG